MNGVVYNVPIYGPSERGVRQVVWAL